MSLFAVEKKRSHAQDIYKSHHAKHGICLWELIFEVITIFVLFTGRNFVSQDLPGPQVSH